MRKVQLPGRRGALKVCLMASIAVVVMTVSPPQLGQSRPMDAGADFDAADSPSRWCSFHSSWYPREMIVLNQDAAAAALRDAIKSLSSCLPVGT
jgi:hypothetical protein